VAGEVRYYTLEDAARILRLYPDRVREMLEDGEIEGARTGNTDVWRIPLRGDPDVPPPPVEATTPPPPTEPTPRPAPEPPTRTAAARTKRSRRRGNRPSCPAETTRRSPGDLFRGHLVIRVGHDAAGGEGFGDIHEDRPLANRARQS
jgi:excisionase family DNA binding protein